MSFTDRLTERYAGDHSNVFQETILEDLERNTNLEVMRPKMLSGFLQGQLLAFLSIMKKPKSILEVGTFTGYASICLAQGLLENGILHTIDNNPEIDQFAKDHLKRCNREHQIIKHLGDAMDIIPQLNLKWDLVFLDADKINYLNYYNLILPRMNKDGIIIADNVLWYGQVLDTQKDKRAEALDRFNKHVQSDHNVHNILLPIRDGLMLIKKK